MKAREEHPLTYPALALAFRRTAELTIRGGGKPYSNMGTDADRENGPAARSFAADAHGCIMVRIKRSYRIQVCGTKMPPMASSLRSSTDRQYRSDAEAMQKAPVAVHHPSACSANLTAGDGTNELDPENETVG